MTPTHNKFNIIRLAKQIFINDIQSPDTRSLETKRLAGAAIFTAEVFYEMAFQYHEGALDTALNRAHESDELEKERRQTEDRRKGDRRTEAKGCTCSEQEDEAFARMEKALLQHFQTAVIGISKG